MSPYLSGLDSRYNDGCTELAKYLFYELYVKKPRNLEHGLEEFPEEMLDGTFFNVFDSFCNGGEYFSDTSPVPFQM